MFTGIVQTAAIVNQIERYDDFLRIKIQTTSQLLEGLEMGASIAINGVCLTASKFNSQFVEFDVIDETLIKTNLGQLCVGDPVNFERSLTFGKEIGGHIVSGHIQTTAKIIMSQANGKNWVIELEVEPEWMKYILHKGFVGVNGCSLTVGDVTDSGFKLHLIPETLNITNLQSYKVGDLLNIEVDQQTYTTVQTVERIMAQQREMA